MPSQEEMWNESQVLFGNLDVLELARMTAEESFAEQKWRVLRSFLNKYAGKFPQVVLAGAEGYRDLRLARLLGQLDKETTSDSPLQYSLLLVVPTDSSQPVIMICITDEKQVYRYLQEIHLKLSGGELFAAARACINARLGATEELPQVAIPEGFLALRFDAMWAAGGHDDDHPTTFEVVIEANDIHSGFDTFKERLLDGWWLGQKNFIGSFLIAFPPNSDHPHCGKWHRLELVSTGARNPPAWGHYWSVAFDWHKAKLADEPIVPFPRCVA